MFRDGQAHSENFLQKMTFLTNFQPRPNFEQIPTGSHSKDMICLIGMILTNTKSWRTSVRVVSTKLRAEISAMVSEREGFRLRKSISFL